MARGEHDDAHILPDGPRREGLLVLGLAEVAAPEDSLVWSLLGAAERQIRRREEDGAPAGGLMTLKLRSLTPRLAPLIRQARHTVLLQGVRRTAESTPSILRRRLKAAGGVWAPVLSMPHGVRDPHPRTDLWTLVQERLGSAAESEAAGGRALWHPAFDPLTDLRAADGETLASGRRSDQEAPRGRPKVPSANEAAGATASDAPDESAAPPWPPWLGAAAGPSGIDHCRIALPAKGDLAWVFPEMGIWFPEVVVRLAGILWEIIHERADGGTGTLDSGHVA